MTQSDLCWVTAGTLAALVVTVIIWAWRTAEHTRDEIERELAKRRR